MKTSNWYWLTAKFVTFYILQRFGNREYHISGCTDLLRDCSWILGIFIWEKDITSLILSFLSNEIYLVFDAILTGRQNQSEITVFVWESDGKYVFPESNFSQFVNQNVKILGRRLYSPSFKDVAVLEVDELTFLICHAFVCKFFSREPRLGVCLPSQIYRQMYGKFEKLTERLPAKLNPWNLVNTIFYLVF